METLRRMTEMEWRQALRLLEDLFEEVRLLEDPAGEWKPAVPAVRSRPFQIVGERDERTVRLELAGQPAAWWEELYQDELTGIYNRRYLKEFRGVGQDAWGSLGVILLDLREFKQINDRKGHLTGDLLLRQVAEALLDAVGTEGQVVRWGGDEFVILLPRCGRGRVRSRMEKLRGVVNAVAPADFGCAWTGRFSGDRRQLLALVDWADRRMYVEKRRNRPRAR